MWIDNSHGFQVCGKILPLVKCEININLRVLYNIQNHLFGSPIAHKKASVSAVAREFDRGGSG
jgi:hypothetical protein